MANQWFRMYSEFATLSDSAHRVAEIAYSQAEKRRYCYPDWRKVEKDSGLDMDEFMSAFDELCMFGVVSDKFPSLLISLSEKFPIAPMFGPISNARPSSEVWKKIRIKIFKRDNFTCQYCGKRGVKLECDHVIPVAKGGSHNDENLVTACFECNRSKKDKLVHEWRGE